MTADVTTAPAKRVTATLSGDHLADLWQRRRVLWTLLALLLSMIVINIGAAPNEVALQTPAPVVIGVIAQHIPFIGKHITLPPTVRDVDRGIAWNIRLPRALCGVGVGILLALAGVAFQSLLMNPLADPYTTGVASGSALGTIALTLAGYAAYWGGYALVGASFASGLLAVSIVYLLARINGRVSAQTFLLSGTIVGSFFFALIPLLLSRAANGGGDAKAVIMSSLFGSLNTVGWPQAGILAPFCVLGVFLMWRGSSELDMMTLGEESAAHLGVDTESFKRRIIVLGSLLTAAAVSVAGIIAFVGFLVPHLARRLVGPNHRDLVLASALLGGFTLTLTDYLSRVWLDDLQIGVVTSLLGVPFFCALLRRRMLKG